MAYSNSHSPFKQDHTIILQTKFFIGEIIYEQVFSNSNNQQAHNEIIISLVKIMLLPGL